MVRDTQLESFIKIGPKLYARQASVFQVIAGSDNGMPLFKIVDKLGWPINRVSGRVTELAKRGLIIDSARREINPSSGRRAIVWEVTAAGQLELL